jgi:sugar transferase (PEP-CTERM/EpsH1 system associated)
MKVLFLCHRFPYPPRSGANVRAFHIIRHLSATGHDVTVASLARSSREEQEASGIARYCRHYEMVRVHEPMQAARMLMRLPTATPSTMGFFYSPALARRVRELLAGDRFDLIYAYCSSMAQYVAGIRGTPKILDFLDMDSQKWLDYARFKSFPLAAGYWLEGKKLEREEKRVAREFDLCTTITRTEWETLESYGTGAATDWFPNGVDSDYFSPGAETYDADAICFVGRMNYYPNQECMVDFCTNVLPRIRARRPQVKLLIIGAEPSRAVRRLADLSGVTVTGSVPDVRPYLRRSALMVAPLNIARGIQNKILEAMAAGVPVVASRVAAGGVDAVPDEHFLVAGTHEEYARCALRILEDAAFRQQLSAAGRKRMLSHHSWERAMRRLDAIIARCLSTWNSVRDRPVAAGGRSFERAPRSPAPASAVRGAGRNSLDRR